MNPYAGDAKAALAPEAFARVPRATIVAFFLPILTVLGVAFLAFMGYRLEASDGRLGEPWYYGGAISILCAVLGPVVGLGLGIASLVKRGPARRLALIATFVNFCFAIPVAYIVFLGATGRLSS